jgi:hypothetical protein
MLNRVIFFIDFFYILYVLYQHCFIFCPSDSTESEDGGRI